MNESFEVVGVADDSGRLDAVAAREGIRTSGRAVMRLPRSARWPICGRCSGLFRLFHRERP